ncbi:hypothetical protein FHX48_002048 [Microbacterium halimionae]|uniref:Uncharacterized protein n=1 Tax=Microbacterium halimionae TaxID=1526413 RepID=A0A7W3JQ42_9MICO|nr:hypothetical protein [Microbacterium halimionae]MBA8816954.1 hypothetical protein [Microbacterium halimionae]NII94507.1 hypothetical protein [Microbacterium halimionae]
MILFVVVAAISLTAVAGTIIAVARDGFRPVATDPARVPPRPDASLVTQPAPAVAEPAPEPLASPTDLPIFAGADAVAPTNSGKSAGVSSSHRGTRASRRSASPSRAA